MCADKDVEIGQEVEDSGEQKQCQFLWWMGHGDVAPGLRVTAYEATKNMMSGVHLRTRTPTAKNDRKANAIARSSIASTRCGNLP